MAVPHADLANSTATDGLQLVHRRRQHLLGSKPLHCLQHQPGGSRTSWKSGKQTCACMACKCSAASMLLSCTCIRYHVIPRRCMQVPFQGAKILGSCKGLCHFQPSRSDACHTLWQSLRCHIGELR